MFKPKYLICLDKRAFPPEQVVCLGSQLKSIVESLSELIAMHVWFCADVDAFSPIPTKLGIDSFRLKKIGNDSSLIDLCENIDQFIWGVFLCIDSNFSSQNIQNVELETEDESFRPIPCDGVLIEIRAFDTSYFALYSEDLALMKKISAMYNVEIEESDS